MSSDDAPDNRSVWDRLAAIPDVDSAAPGPEAAPHERELAPDIESPPPPQDPRRVAVPPSPGPPSAPDSQPEAPGPSGPAGPAPSSRRRRRWRWAVTAVAVLLVAVAGFVLYAAVMWNRIDRVDTAGTLSPGGQGFTNYLVVGTDSRENVDPDDPAADDVGLGFEGTRADSMILLHVGPDGNHLVSLPRDLRVDIPGHGGAKLNAARSFGGAPLLIETVKTQLGVPVHRYLEVDLAGFMDVVDAVGGVTVDFPQAACDVKSGLFVAETGPVELDREQALAYVRSRSYTEFDASAATGMTTCREVQAAGLGRPSGDDLDRTSRQRTVLVTTLQRAAGSWNPIRLVAVLGELSGGVVVDDQMSFTNAFSLATTARNLDATDHELPVAYAGADVVLVGESAAVLDLFRPR